MKGGVVSGIMDVTGREVTALKGAPLAGSTILDMFETNKKARESMLIRSSLIIWVSATESVIKHTLLEVHENVAEVRV